MHIPYANKCPANKCPLPSFLAYDGKLNLPYCTSWREPGENELCRRKKDAIPGSPNSCQCDDSFEVDIEVLLQLVAGVLTEGKHAEAKCFDVQATAPLYPADIYSIDIGAVTISSYHSDMAEPTTGRIDRLTDRYPVSWAASTGRRVGCELGRHT